MERGKGIKKRVGRATRWSRLGEEVSRKLKPAGEWMR